MRLTRTQLRRLITEEIDRLMVEKLEAKAKVDKKGWGSSNSDIANLAPKFGHKYGSGWNKMSIDKKIKWLLGEPHPYTKKPGK
jgi:hypothetical protein